MRRALYCWVSLLCAGPLVGTPSPARADWPNDPTANVPVCTAPLGQDTPAMLPTSDGGAFIAWTDGRSNFLNQVYVQRLDAFGQVAFGWPVNGVLASGTRFAYNAQLVTDGAGGVIVSWDDLISGPAGDIYAQRLTAAGTIAAGWPTNGVPLCSAVGVQQVNRSVSDGAGGAIVVWEDYRGGGFDADIYAQHIRDDGTIAPGWPTAAAGGAPVCTAANASIHPNVATDGQGGAYVAWQDERSGLHVYMQHLNTFGLPVAGWALNGSPVCPSLVDASEGNEVPGLVADGSGGAIVVWDDGRAGFGVLQDLYAQHLLANGTLAPGWVSAGTMLCMDTGHPSTNRFFSAIADGSGGALVAWEDGRAVTRFDIYAQRITGAGVIAPGWPSATAGGSAACTFSGDQRFPALASDGLGGVIIAWKDSRSASGSDIFAQHLTADGSIAPGWPSAAAGGLAISTAANSQGPPAICTAPSGGAIAAWSDGRAGDSDIYAQRVTRVGVLAPEPRLAGVHDVAGDQGGRVRLDWLPSPLDGFPAEDATSYWIWRQVPVTGPAARASRFERSHAAIGSVRAVVTSSATQFWELVATEPAHGLAGYSYTVPTTTDSLAGSNPYTTFMVECEQTSTGMFWDSEPDSGYSVDNLPPPAPSSLVGQWDPSLGTLLRWAPSDAPDVTSYRIYRGTTSSFVPGAGTLVGLASALSFADHSGTPASYYKVSAVDMHGNEGPSALLTPAGTLDVPGDGRTATFAFDRPVPSPARVAARLVYTIPRASRVRVMAFDISGRARRVLLDRSELAGEHELEWDLCDASGQRLESGLYLLRLETDGRTLTRPIGIVR